MDYNFNTRLKGNLSLSNRFHRDREMQKDKSLYKFIWVQEGCLRIEIDHVEITVEKDEIISLTPLHHIRITEAEGEYITLLFNSNFYCIYGHDNEVSCNGFLFNGSSDIVKLKLSGPESESLHEITGKMIKEYDISDNLQEEMLRILLKRFIITCTRIARKTFSVTPDKEKGFDIIRQYYVLVDQHFRQKKKVREYADMLYRSPKTLSNLFTLYGFPSPLQIIHRRVEAEARRLLLYTSKSGKEIARILGFEDISAFSRFFRKMTGESLSEYRKREKADILKENP